MNTQLPSGGTSGSRREFLKHTGSALVGTALTGALATVSLDSSGNCENARIVLFGIGATAVRAASAEAMVNGEKPNEAVFAAAATKAADELDEPLTDVHASAEFRRHLAGVLCRRALTEAAGRARS